MSSKLSLAGCGLLVALPLAFSTAGCAGKSSTVTRAERGAELAPEGGALVGLVDEGPRTINCDLAAGIDWTTVFDFEEGGASAWYTYDDGTSPVPIQPPMSTTPLAAGWGLTGTDLNTAPGGARCGSNYALHVVGGPYSGYGGGFGTTGYFTLHGELAQTYGVADGAGYAPRDTGVGLDLRSYKGIALWARHVEGSMGAIKLGLTDKYVNEDASRLASNAGDFSRCPLARGCGCPAGQTCQQEPAMTWGCYPDGVAPGTPQTDDAGVAVVPAKCGETACVGDPMLPNAVLDGSACVSVTTSDGNVGDYCYDQGVDPMPTPGNQRCGAAWGASISLSSDWKF
ncbi:MAG TPA: hypothetical protein VGP93_20545, partial [Polyangiaceae bacterium]|nr:hypothetical protein [Polyangiaceae bacterium]